MIVLQIDKPIPIPLWESTEPVLWQMPLKISGITSGFRPCPKSLTQKVTWSGWSVTVSSGVLLHWEDFQPYWGASWSHFQYFQEVRFFLHLIRWNHQTEERKWLLWWAMYDQHSDKCDRIAAQCEIQSEKRIGKEEIDTDYGENRRKEPVQVSVRISCNQDMGNNIK